MNEWTLGWYICTAFAWTGVACLSASMIMWGFLIK